MVGVILDHNSNTPHSLQIPSISEHMTLSPSTSLTVHPQINPGNQDLKAYDNFKIREVLRTTKKSHEDMKTLLHTHSTPAVKEMVESPQAVRTLALYGHKKEGLSRLRENNRTILILYFVFSNLSQTLIVTGQIILSRRFSNETIIGMFGNMLFL